MSKTTQGGKNGGNSSLQEAKGGKSSTAGNGNGNGGSGKGNSQSAGSDASKSGKPGNKSK